MQPVSYCGALGRSRRSRRCGSKCYRGAAPKARRRLPDRAAGAGGCPGSGLGAPRRRQVAAETGALRMRLDLLGRRHQGPGGRPGVAGISVVDLLRRRPRVPEGGGRRGACSMTIVRMAVGRTGRGARSERRAALRSSDSYWSAGASEGAPQSTSTRRAAYAGRDNGRGGWVAACGGTCAPGASRALYGSVRADSLTGFSPRQHGVVGVPVAVPRPPGARAAARSVGRARGDVRGSGRGAGPRHTTSAKLWSTGAEGPSLFAELLRSGTDLSTETAL